MKLEGADSEITFFPNKNENTSHITTRTLNVSQLMKNLDIQKIMMDNEKQNLLEDG